MKFIVKAVAFAVIHHYHEPQYSYLVETRYRSVPREFVFVGFMTETLKPMPVSVRRLQNFLTHENHTDTCVGNQKSNIQTNRQQISRSGKWLKMPHASPKQQKFSNFWRWDHGVPLLRNTFGDVDKDTCNNHSKHTEYTRSRQKHMSWMEINLSSEHFTIVECRNWLVASRMFRLLNDGEEFGVILLQYQCHDTFSHLLAFLIQFQDAKRSRRKRRSLRPAKVLVDQPHYWGQGALQYPNQRCQRWPRYWYGNWREHTIRSWWIHPIQVWGRHGFDCSGTKERRYNVRFFRLRN